jgi:hypothetical protein
MRLQWNGDRRLYWEHRPVRQGVRVRSCYRAPWFGVVWAVSFDRMGRELPAGCVEVKVTHDKRGRLLRRPLWKVISARWLRPSKEPVTP